MREQKFGNFGGKSQEQRFGHFGGKSGFNFSTQIFFFTSISSISPEEDTLMGNELNHRG